MFKILSEKMHLKSPFSWSLSEVLKAFKKEIYSERYIVSMKVQKSKTWRIEQMADAFLERLSTEGVDGEDAVLTNFLDDQKVYYDGQMLGQAIDLLLQRKFIKEVENTLTIFGHFEAPANAEPGKILHPADWLGDMEATIRQSVITAKGRDFVRQGQKLDVVGVAERKANREKWKERGITFCIALATAVGIALVTEPVKRLLNKEKPQNNNESSPVRPRFDPRQRPEPGKSTRAATPRS